MQNVAFVSSGAGNYGFLIILVIAAMIGVWTLGLIVYNHILLMRLNKKEPEYLKPYRLLHYLLLFFTALHVLASLNTYAPYKIELLQSLLLINPYAWLTDMFSLGGQLLPFLVMLAHNTWLRSRLKKTT